MDEETAKKVLDFFNQNNLTYKDILAIVGGRMINEGLNKDEILRFERAITDTGHILVPRTSINVNTVKAMTEQERQDMLILLEHAKEIFRKGSKYYIGGNK